MKLIFMQNQNLMYVVVQFDQDVFLTGLVTFILAQHYEHLDNPNYMIQLLNQ